VLSPSVQAQSFYAAYDSVTKIVSATLCMFFLIAVALSKSPILLFVVLMIVFLGYAYSPRGYTISGQALVVKRLIGDIRIPLLGVREIRRASKDDFRGCIRLWGSGGFFGYYGLFRTSKLGKSTWYITNRRNTVVLITETKTALFSPDDVDAFLAAVHQAAPVLALTPGAHASYVMEPHRYGGLIGLVVGCVLAIAGIAFGVFAVRYAPGPPTYTLTRENLMIRDLFYPVTLNASNIDVDHIRIIDFGVDRDWRPTARTNGFANSHYRSGWFRVANGQKVRIYEAGGRRVVLLPPRGDGVPVLLEVTEPDEFLQKLRQQW
jgi:hypothetical protein